ncbi:hypothetical protein FS595_23100 [Serratia rubidaea]|uniref:hypothetical protein n=1 Tax=Serratia TaxID=613 RepID=UPI0008FFD2EA|nr:MULTISPECIES: hypothetical protein [Serratia]UJD82443.1 hypothetical protein FS596_23105 [Serratia rubidaea]UJD87008.1 hypothetical protein FS595_23100 [Serratia rubidaea]
MSFLTEPFFLFGIVVTVLALVLSFAMFKPNKSQLTTMKDWVSREKWTGTTIVVPLESWNQTDSKYGNDFFYDFYFMATIGQKPKRYCAKGLVRANDIHKLKKGLELVVKYSDDTPPKIAVINVNY